MSSASGKSNVGRPTVGLGVPSQAPQRRKRAAPKSRGRPPQEPPEYPHVPEALPPRRAPADPAARLFKRRPRDEQILRCRMQEFACEAAGAVFKNCVCGFQENCGCGFLFSPEVPAKRPVLQNLRMQFSKNCVCSFAKYETAPGRQVHDSLSAPLVLQTSPQSKTTSPRLICSRALRMGGAPLKSSLAKPPRTRPAEGEKLAPAVLALKTANVRTNNFKTNSRAY